MARLGSFREVATALIVAALAACSVLSVYGELVTSQLADCAIGSFLAISDRTPNAATVTSTPDHEEHDDGAAGHVGRGHTA